MAKAIKKSKSGNHAKRQDISSHIDSLWKKVGKKLKSRGTKSADVRKAIKAVRKVKG